MAFDATTYALAKNYANKVGSTINGTSYDYDTGELTFSTVDGDWTVPVNNGMNATYKQTLDNVTYSDGALEVNGTKVVTEDDIATGNIDFSGMF